ncbi:MAG: putative hydro-lyase [Paracoccaceae bacterium]|nr:putative hydro-lyase [Paracoccaceae bacterium]
MTSNDYSEMLKLPVADLRERIRAGAYRGQTAGFAPGNLQANLAILGDGYAEDFREFCDQNSQPCPLVGVSGRGDPAMPMLGDIDIRTDVPSYNVYRRGELTDTVHDITGLWTDDMVAFALGCSFTFERALSEAGIRMKHIEANKTVPMFRTNIALNPVGPFTGTMVVSMRPISRDQVNLAIEITSRYPHAHGAPVHVGDGEKIGVSDIGAPHWGEPADFGDGDVPVYWACGVTPQNVLSTARPEICITHTPGRMLVTDIPSKQPPMAVV